MHPALVVLALEHWNIVQEERVMAPSFAMFPRVVPAGAPMRIRFKNNGPVELTFSVELRELSRTPPLGGRRHAQRTRSWRLGA